MFKVSGSLVFTAVYVNRFLKDNVWNVCNFVNSSISKEESLLIVCEIILFTSEAVRNDKHNIFK